MKNSVAVQPGSCLPRSFYHRSALDVARDLLGKTLSVTTPEGETHGFIVETEAYLGLDDPASHAYRGKTARNAVMFGEAGHVYVYFIYGAHHCVNAVARPEATPAGAVLLRAVQPWRGLLLMARRRGLAGDVPDRLEPGDPVERRWRLLTNGPGKLTQAMGIGPHHNGGDLCDGSLCIGDGGVRLPPFTIQTSARIGIRLAADRLYRFYIGNNPFVSR